MYLFYKSSNLHELIFLLLTKARAETLCVSVCLLNENECFALSNYLWAKGMPHGVIGDEFQDLQPVFIDTILDCSKKCAIIAANFNESFAGKILFIGNIGSEYDGKYYSYENNKWQPLTKAQYYA